MTAPAATLDRIEELTAERDTAADVLRRAADSLDMERQRFREGSASQTVLEAAESRHRAAAGVHSQVVADLQNAADERRISERSQSVRKLKTDAQELHRSGTENVARESKAAIELGRQLIRQYVRLSRVTAAAHQGYRDIEQLAEQYARATGLLTDESSQLDCENMREKVMREEWNIPVELFPLGTLFPPIQWPGTTVVEYEQAQHEINIRAFAPLLSRLGGLK